MNTYFLVGVVECVLRREEALNDYIKDSGPKKIHVDVYLLKVLTEGRQTPLEAIVIMLQTLVLNIVLTLLIDRVVGQMNKFVFNSVIRVVLLRGKTCKSFLIDIDA